VPGERVFDHYQQRHSPILATLRVPPARPSGPAAREGRRKCGIAVAGSGQTRVPPARGRRGRLRFESLHSTYMILTGRWRGRRSRSSRRRQSPRRRATACRHRAARRRHRRAYRWPSSSRGARASRRGTESKAPAAAKRPGRHARAHVRGPPCRPDRSSSRDRRAGTSAAAGPRARRGWARRRRACWPRPAPRARCST